MRRRAILAMLSFAMLVVDAGTVAAAVGAAPMAEARKADARVRTFMYDPDAVVSLKAFLGYQMTIQFGADERIEDVAIGDGSTWQVTPNNGANLVFLKPMENARSTNMTVITDRRRYLFELTANASDGQSPDQMVYLVRFEYPPETTVAVTPAPPPPPPPEQRNRAYTYTGSHALLPSQVFDDGQFTYFKWPESVTTPAVFLLAPDGAESLADYSFRDGYQVVEQVAPRFRLRNGKDVTTIINDGWREPLPGTQAPRPHNRRSAQAARAENEP